jgi:hypothetical protein
MNGFFLVVLHFYMHANTNEEIDGGYGILSKIKRNF